MLRRCHVQTLKILTKWETSNNNILSKQELILVCKMKWICYVVHTEKSLPINKVNWRILDFQNQRQMSVQRRYAHTHIHIHTLSFFDILFFDLLLLLLLKFLKLWLAGGYCFLHQKDRSGLGGGRAFHPTVHPRGHLSLWTVLFT